MNEIKRLSDNLKKDFMVIHDHTLSDEDVSKLKSEMPGNLKKVDIISKHIKDLLECSESGDVESIEEIRKITKDFNKLCCDKDDYIEFINNEVKTRELSKRELFNEGKLKINLAKFSGYESKSDIYTFQSEFKKIYERTTPKRLLPDLLKNNSCCLNIFF